MGQKGGYVAGRVLSGMRAGAAFECSWSVPSKAGREKGRGWRPLGFQEVLFRADVATATAATAATTTITIYLIVAKLDSLQG